MQVVISTGNTSVLLEDGSLYMWGNNSYGQLGNGSSDNVQHFIPTQVEPSYFDDKKIVKIQPRTYGISALTTDGIIYIWGHNGFGQLGDGSTTNGKIPMKLNTENFGSNTVSQMQSGYYHSVALLSDGSLYTWGWNGYGQLGNGRTENVRVPTKINTPMLTSPIKKIAVSYYSTIVILENNDVYECGKNNYGQINPDTASSVLSLIKRDTSMFNSDIMKISAADGTYIFLLEDGSAYTWGNNLYGQLGNGSTSGTTAKPAIVDSKYFGNEKIVDVLMGQNHVIALTETHKIYVWGRNDEGQLGTNSDSSIPIWMPKLGIVSNIAANSQLTAKAAVENIWVANKFQPDNFKNSFVNNLHDVPDQYTMTSKPTYDNYSGTVTLKMGIKYFYDAEGRISPVSSSSQTIITGFKPSKTKITVKNDPRKDVVVDKWLASVKDEIGQFDRTKLAEYLDIINAPENAVFTISDLVPTLSTGALKFKITSSITLNEDDTISGASDPFDITLNLIPKVTKVTTRTDYNPIAVDKLEALVFDANGVANLDEIKKFIKIDAMVENAKLQLKPDSYKINTGMGTADFTVSFDKYYDNAGAEKTQTAASPAISYPIHLQLKPMASVITSKATYTPNHRVDRFISTFSDATGKVTNETILKQYLDIQNLPTGYALTIENVNINSEIDGTISFDVIASSYNDLNFELKQDGKFPIRLLKLLPKHPTTDISAKAEGDYDYNVRLDRFTELFSDANGLVTNLDKLGEFVDIISLPADATLNVKNVKKTDATGRITFDLVADKYYNETSDLTSSTKSYPIVLNLGIKYLPTEITANPNVVYPERVDRFATKIADLSGSVDLQTYLAPKYITIVGDLPKNTTFSVTNVVPTEDTGKITFDLIASAFYDENSDRIENKVISIELQLRVKFAPTVLSAKTKDDFTSSERVDRFEHTIKMFSNDDLKAYLSDFVDGINTLVIGSQLSATNVSGNVDTGIINFTLNTNKYYDADSDLQIADKSWTITLELELKHVATTIEAKTGDFTNIIVDQFIPSFTNEQLEVDDQAELDKYVDIKGLPADANLSVKDANMTFNTGRILFKIVADKFYDGESDLVTLRTQEYIIELTLGIKYQATKISNIKGYDQSENVETFANQIKTLTGKNLEDYLATYIQTKGDVVATSVTSIDLNSITLDSETGRVSFIVKLSEYYDETGALASDGSFKINLRLAF